MKKTVTLPLKYWDLLEELQEVAGGTLSDALFTVVDLGFKALEEEEETEEEEEDLEETESLEEED